MNDQSNSKDSTAHQSEPSNQTTPISPTKTITAPTPLSTNIHLETPHATEPHPIDPLSNLAASSANTVEINAKLLAMSNTSHDTSLGDLLSNDNNNISHNSNHNINSLQHPPLMRELPSYSQPLHPNPTYGEQLERHHLQHVQELRGGKILDSSNMSRAAPQCAGTNDQPRQQQQQQQQNLHISTSAISLALSTALSTPADTPLTPGEECNQLPLKRARSLSIQQTEAILMGLDDGSEDEDGPAAKKKQKCGVENVDKSEEGENIVVSNKPQETVIDAEKQSSHDGEEKKEECFVTLVPKEATAWSVRQNLGVCGPENRWRAHQIAEDYITLASSITLPPTYLGSFGYSPTTGQYPIEQVTALGYLTSPLRRPTVIEKWSPYEITTFEAAMTLHGKQFHLVQKWVKTKCTKEIVEFYYIWKKTSHYRRWKGQFESEIESEDESEEEGKEEESSGKGRRVRTLPASPARRGRR